MASGLTRSPFFRRKLPLVSQSEVHVRTLWSENDESGSQQRAERFLDKVQGKSIDAGIVRQQIPIVLLDFIEDNPLTAGPLVKRLMEEVRAEQQYASAKAYAVVSQLVSI